MDNLPDRARVGRALDYLVSTDEPYARACAALEAAEMAMKQAREIAFLEAEGTQGERASKANASGAVRLSAKAVETAVFEKELLKARRATALVLIDIWRSLNSNQRAGVV
jgi:histidine ammonia-lyase